MSSICDGLREIKNMVLQSSFEVILMHGDVLPSGGCEWHRHFQPFSLVRAKQ
jgi:hypothetical protein